MLVAAAGAAAARDGGTAGPVTATADTPPCARPPGPAPKSSRSSGRERRWRPATAAAAGAGCRGTDGRVRRGPRPSPDGAAAVAGRARLHSPRSPAPRRRERSGLGARGRRGRRRRARLRARDRHRGGMAARRRPGKFRGDGRAGDRTARESPRDRVRRFDPRDRGTPRSVRRPSVQEAVPAVADGRVHGRRRTVLFVCVRRPGARRRMERGVRARLDVLAGRRRWLVLRPTWSVNPRNGQQSAAVSVGVLLAFPK